MTTERPAAASEWQNLLRSRLMAKQAAYDPYRELIEQSHLDAELSALRAELSTLYRTQAAAQNKQLSLSDALRDRDEEVRGLREEVRLLRDARDGLLRKEAEWGERWKMRTRDMETLNDELLSLNLEISSISQKNAALQADNASLLQRWIDKMNLTAEEMNEEFEKEAGGVPRGNAERPGNELLVPDGGGEAKDVRYGKEGKDFRGGGKGP